MPIPLRSLRFIHSTYTRTRIGRGSIPGVAPLHRLCTHELCAAIGPARAASSGKLERPPPSAPQNPIRPPSLPNRATPFVADAVTQSDQAIFSPKYGI